MDPYLQYFLDREDEVRQPCQSKLKCCHIYKVQTYEVLPVAPDVAFCKTKIQVYSLRHEVGKPKMSGRFKLVSETESNGPMMRREQLPEAVTCPLERRRPTQEESSSEEEEEAEGAQDVRQQAQEAEEASSSDDDYPYWDQASGRPQRRSRSRSRSRSTDEEAMDRSLEYMERRQHLHEHFEDTYGDY